MAGSLITAFENLRSRCPLIHNITNYVTVNDCANIVLAAGASPIMADDPEEVEEITALSRALCLSLGTPNPRKAEAMVKAGRTAARLGLPMVFDPVGVGASPWRLANIQSLLQQVQPAIVRVNAGEAAALLGRSPSALANKLRLLRLPGTVVELLQQGDLSERHARALLRLADEEEQLAAAKTIIARGLNVAQAEEYIESLLRKIQVTPPHRRPTFILKDVRLFLNSLDRSLSLMRSAGVNAACGRQDTEDEILLTIRIPKARRVG